MPRRAGSAIPSATHQSTPAMMSRKSIPPGSPSSPPRRRGRGPSSRAGSAGGPRSRHRRAGRRSAPSRRSRRSSTRSGRHGRRRSSATVPGLACGVIRRPSISMPSGAAQRTSLTSGNVRPSTTASLKPVRRVHSPVAASNLASSGGRPCAWWHAITVPSPSRSQDGFVRSGPMNASPSQRSRAATVEPQLPDRRPVPAYRAYQRRSASAHATRPTVSRPGHGSVAEPSARSTIVTLPVSSPGSLE